MLGTLGEVVGVDDLNAVVERAPAGSGESDPSLAFEYCGYSVEAYSDRTLLVEY